jgi:hypothetical protein
MRMTLLLSALAILACEPPKAPPAENATMGAPSHPDACHDDIPDCAAACALRETSRRDFIDFYDRRCAAVILGKNPDKVEPLQPTPYLAASASASSSGAAFPPDVRASLMMPRAFDPAAVTRTGGAEPPECKAARILRASRRDREADMMDAMCIAKGGDAGT